MDVAGSALCVAQLGAARLHSLTAVNVRRSCQLNKSITLVIFGFLLLLSKVLVGKRVVYFRGAGRREDGAPTNRASRQIPHGGGKGRYIWRPHFPTSKDAMNWKFFALIHCAGL